ncbi:MAG: twin transmembrane helix small protein [Gammaproteobacteria bacterium]|nr:twin transmembrane helix small protein [Gammaproteobacteria bacterium]
MLPKIVILVLLVLMVYSLFSALYFLYRDRGQGERTLKALTARISIWVALFAFLYIGVHVGWITPSNSIRPPLQAPQTR